MNWKRGTERGSYILSDPPGFIVGKSGEDRIVYMAVKLGKPWKPHRNDYLGAEPRAWDGSTILHVERDIDPRDEDARKAALARCKAACEAANV